MLGHDPTYKLQECFKIAAIPNLWIFACVEMIVVGWASEPEKVPVFMFDDI